MTVEVIDLQTSSQGGRPTFDLFNEIIRGLSRPAGEKQLSSVLLWDERGMRLFDEMATSAPEYYIFAAEEEIIKSNIRHIVQSMHAKESSSSEVILELGAGSLRKTSHILAGISQFAEQTHLKLPVTYYALDLEKRELQRTLGEMETSSIGGQLRDKVITKGLCATFDEGLQFIENGGLVSGRRFDKPDDPIAIETPARGNPERMHVIFLGASLGNFSRQDAAAFLQSLPLRASSGDTLLVGLDHDNAKDQIERAYNDPKGYYKRFALNILRHAGRILGDESLFGAENWDYVNCYNSEDRKHEGFLEAKCRHIVRLPSTGDEFIFVKGERLKVAESVKYSDADASSLFKNSNLKSMERWIDSRGLCSLWLLERA